MTTKTAPPTDTPFGVDFGAYEDATQRIRDLNERIVESSKAAGLTTLSRNPGIKSITPVYVYVPNRR